MSKDALSAACNEYIYWVKELEKTEPYRKAAVLANFITGYGGTLPNVKINPASTVARLEKAVNTSKKEQIESLCDEAIRANGGYAPADKIHEYFISKGFDINRNTLGWHLSKSGLFAPDRKLGWSIKE